MLNAPLSFIEGAFYYFFVLLFFTKLRNAPA